MACCGAKRGGGAKGFEGEKCDDCRGWEEELYWKRFQPLHFCQILRPGSVFQKQLPIPKKFARNAKALLPPKVTLRGPSGASWCATMTKKGDDLFISDGWEEFAKAYTLHANSILIFKYDGNSVFDVLIFDGESMCEKESGYFVKKCGHADPSTELQRKGVSTEAAIEENDDNPVTARQRKRVSSEAGIEENDDNPVRKATKQAKKGVGKKTVDESPKLDHTVSNGKTGRKKKPASRKNMSSKAKERERTPITSSENACDSFAMLAELGKTIVQNATSFMEPENTTEFNATESPKAPKISGGISPEVPSQGTPLVNGSLSYRASGRGRKAANKKSLNEASLKKFVSAKSKSTSTKEAASPKSKSTSTKELGSPGKRKYTKKKVASSVAPHDMQPSATGDMDLTPFGSADRKRTYVSESGKVALDLARQQMTDTSFLLILRPTNVYKRFMVTVPPQWFRKHLPPNSQDVILRLEDKTWLTKLGFSPCKGTGQICGGWRQFVQDNHLEEFDVCVFTLVSEKDNTTMLDVSIFRAGPTMATPLNQRLMDDTIIITPLDQVVFDDTPMLIIE